MIKNDKRDLQYGMGAGRQDLNYLKGFKSLIVYAEDHPVHGPQYDLKDCQYGFQENVLQLICQNCRSEHHSTVNTYEGGRTVECLSCGEIFEVDDV